MVKTSNVALMVLIAFAVGFILGAVTWRKYRPCVNLPVVSVQRDTVVVRDTVRGEIPAPQKVEVIRVDTVRMEINAIDGTATPFDTVPSDSTRNAKDTPRAGQNGEILVPISRKVYQTEDYRAVVSGWRPSLDSMEVYGKTRTVRETVTRLKNPRWAVTAGGGVGYAADKVVPFLGVSVGLVLWSR